MKNVITKVLSIIAISIMSSVVFATEISLEKARENITQQFDGLSPESISQSPVPGMYQILMPPRIFYASADGRYIFNGDLIDMVKQVNVSQGVRNSSVASSVKNMGEDSMIVFGDSSLKHTVTVFTDIDCGYCRKLHGEIKNYNAAGIRVRYMAYPRAGIGSSAFKKAEAVWCSKDKVQAMTNSKKGLNVQAEKCTNPVAKHYALGESIGIRGTPAIILESGRIIPGYVPAEGLIAEINRK